MAYGSLGQPVFLFGSRKQLVMTAAEQRDVSLVRQRISFFANMVVFIEGEPAESVYKLTHGIAVLYKIMADGRRQIVSFALPGDFLASPFSDTYPCSVETIGEVRADQFLRAPFLDFLWSHPANMCQMIEANLQETNAAREHMLLLGRGRAEEKFVEFVLKWRARIGRKGALANLVPLPMSRLDVADYLGLTIETVSRLLAKLEREKVIRVIPEGLQLMGSVERPLLFQKSHKA
jgi:CRP/FNR family transcriptional regulator